MAKIQKTITGRDSLNRTPELLQKLNIQRPLIVGGSLLTGKLLRKVPALLSCPVFSAYHPNPDLADAEQGVEIYRKEGCDGLLSLGGGSAMDTAKAVKALMGAGSMEKLLRGELPEEMPVPHVAVPGTAGSGAEATPFAVVYVEGKKHSLSHPALLPDGVILDASLLDSLPAYHKKSCALDALSQGIESYWARGATEDSRVHAYLAILGVLDNLKAYLAGDPHAAEQILEAAYQSGKAIAVSRTTAAHAMSYGLTKTLGIAHGHACFLTLPLLWENMLPIRETEDTLSSLSGLMRLGNPLLGPKLLKGILYSLDMEIPPVPDDETLNRLTAGVNPERLGNHPVPLTADQIRDIYRRSFLPPSAMEKQLCLDLWAYYGAEAGPEGR